MNIEDLKTNIRDVIKNNGKQNITGDQLQSVLLEMVDTLVSAGWYNRALYEKRGAVYNEETGYYELNGLTDITEEEMLNIYLFTAFPPNGAINYRPANYSLGSSYSFRTNFPAMFQAGTHLVGNGNQVNSISFYFCNNITVATVIPLNTFNYTENIGTFIDSFGADIFYSCTALKEVIGVINLSGSAFNISTHYSLPVLETIKIKAVSKSFSFFGNAPMISLESMGYFVNNTTNTEIITVLVHRNVYDKLKDTANTEWYAINTAAQAKQISFATI